MGSAAAAIGSSVLGAAGASRAGAQEGGAADVAAQRGYDVANVAAKRLQPYTEAGGTALNKISDLWGMFDKPFTAQDLTTQLAPNYDFMLKYGQRAEANALNAQGGTAGNYGVGLEDYTQNFAKNAYQQAFENQQTQNQNIFNRLYQISGLGETAASNAGQIQVGGYRPAGENYAAGGAARAAGTVGTVNAITRPLTQFAGVGGGGGGPWASLTG